MSPPSPSASPVWPSTFPSAQGERAPTHQIRFHGEGAELFGIWFVNTLLSVLTLGIYHFWGKAKVRQYIFSRIELGESRFAFHGTGKEMLVAWLKLMGIGCIGLFCLGMVTYAFRGNQILSGLLTLMLYGGLFTLLPFVIVGARRYLLSRTSWRGIHFSFRGESSELLPIFLKGVLLSIVTLGFYSPYLANDLTAFLTNYSYYGTRRFNYDGNGDVLFRIYVRTFFLSLITLGIYGFWGIAAQQRYIAEHTSFGDGARLSSRVTGGALFGLVFTNILLIFCTLGLGLPWVIVRTLRFQFENLEIIGSLNTSDIQQAPQKASAVGEELAGMLNVDAGIGFGL